MNWNVRKAAQILRMEENELLRLAKTGEIPAVRVNDQFMFNSVELHEWGSVHHHRVLPEVSRPNEAHADLHRLGAAIERGGVHYDLEGTSSDEVLCAVSQLPTIPEGVDRALLSQVLRARESLSSTGIGSGVAIPHPRDPLVFHISSPAILLCFLAQPVDFKAIDGQPVRTLFTIISPTVPLHLQMLARLAFALHDEALNHLLLQQAPCDALLARIQVLEEHMDEALTAGPAK